MEASSAGGVLPSYHTSSEARASPASGGLDLPPQISALLPTYLPVWRHRAVSKDWHRAVLTALLRATLSSGANLGPELHCMWAELWLGEVQYIGLRIKLDVPEVELEVAKARSPPREAGGEVLLAGPAQVAIVEGCLDGRCEEVARAEGRYTCEVGAGERALVLVRALRVAGMDVGRHEDVDLPVCRVLGSKTSIAL